MLKRILPKEIYEHLLKIGIEKISEIRLRNCGGFLVGIDGKFSFLTIDGKLSPKRVENLMICSQKMIDDIIFKASEFSIYSINEELKKGFLILKDGIRIGICGSIVSENGQIKTLKDFSSLNIRIPHLVKGCAKEIFEKTYVPNKLKNILILSSPGQGKTTMLRDLIAQFLQFGENENILVCDERGEICAKNFDEFLFENCDVLTFCEKKVGFSMGIRSMNPKIIVTDELGLEEDYFALQNAINSGINLIASIHSRNLEELKKKKNFAQIKEIFDYFVCLKSVGKPGQIEGIYDADFNKI